MGLAQDIDLSRQEAIFDKIAEARYYMNNVVALEEKYGEVRESCKNQHSSCAFWAVLGECENK
jgi:ShK domain-like